MIFSRRPYFDAGLNTGFVNFLLTALIADAGLNAKFVKFPVGRVDDDLIAGLV